MITVALAKGRLANESAELFEKCGIDASVVFSDTRKLVLESADKKFSFFLVKPSDVPTYVEYGIADMGIVGKDTLLEHEKDLYEMLDLKFEPCKLQPAPPRWGILQTTPPPQCSPGHPCTGRPAAR